MGGITTLIVAALLSPVSGFHVRTDLPARGQEPIVSRIDVVDAEVRAVVDLLRVQTGADVVVLPANRPYGKVTMTVSNKPLEFVLVKLARAAGAAYRRAGGVYVIAPRIEMVEEAPGSQPSGILQGVHRIVTLGDSITQMGGQPGGYVWLLQKYLTALYPQQQIEVINAGISGHKSTDMAARFQRDVLDKKPDLVTISVGVNDVWHGFYDNHPEGDGPRGVPLDQYRERVEWMITEAEKAKAKVVVLSTTVIHEDLGNKENAKVMRYNEVLRELAARHRCPFVNLFRAFREVLAVYHMNAGPGTTLLTTDGVHMNAAGNKLMAWTILRGLGVPESELAGVKVD